MHQLTHTDVFKNDEQVQNYTSTLFCKIVCKSFFQTPLFFGLMASIALSLEFKYLCYSTDCVSRQKI
jgi:hypothetical protein